MPTTLNLFIGKLIVLVVQQYVDELVGMMLDANSPEEQVEVRLGFRSFLECMSHRLRISYWASSAI